MNIKFLSRVPKEYLCPYCQNWHRWPYGNILGWYDSELLAYAKFECSNIADQNSEEKAYYRFYFDEENIHVNVIAPCNIAKDNIEFVYPLNEISENSTEPTITFTEFFKLEPNIKAGLCMYCPNNGFCSFSKISNKQTNRVDFGFKFDTEDYTKLSEKGKLLDKYNEDVETVQKIFEDEKQIGKIEHSGIAKYKYGGVALNIDGDWTIFDNDKENIKKVEEYMVSNKDTLMLVPSSNINPGDIVKFEQEFCMVTMVNGMCTTLVPETSPNIKLGMPTHQYLGIPCYLKVVYSKNSNDVDIEKLALFAAHRK